MSKQSRPYVYILIAIAMCVFFLFHKKHKKPDTETEVATEQAATTASDTKPDTNNSASTQSATNTTPSPTPDAQDPNQVIQLTSSNFESLIQKCFQGTPCQLAENAWRTYEVLKSGTNTHATSDLISFLKSKLKDPSLKDLYREDLRKMIDDFYPAEEKQFQQASYYASVGEPQKALDLYLDLQEKAADDPNLRTAPNLNIANALYELTRYSDALIYYRMAMDDLTTGSQKAQNQNDLVKFVQQRIDDTRAKINAN